MDASRIGHLALAAVLLGSPSSSAAERQVAPITALNASQLTKMGVIDCGATFISAASFSPDSRSLALVSYDGSFRVWDVQTLREHRIAPLRLRSVWGVRYSPGGDLLAVWGGNELQLRKLPTHETIGTIRCSGEHLQSASFSPDGRLVGFSGSNGVIELWRIAGLERLDTIRGHSGGAMSITFSPDGLHVATGGAAGDSQICLWRLPDLEKVACLAGHGTDVHGLLFARGGERLVSTGPGRTINVWNPETRERITQLTGQNGNIFAVDCTPDGSMLATGADDGTICLWDMDTGRLIHTLRHAGEGFVADLSPDGRWLATTGSNSQVVIWAVPSAR